MAVYNLENYTSADGLGFPMNFRRGAPNPLDNSAVWKSLDEAKNYAQTDPTAYVGQILSVVDNVAGNVDVYKIKNEAGDLELVGTVPVGDGNTVDIGTDGKIKLHGIDDKQTGTYQPSLVNGVLTWAVPSTTTVEGLSTEIEGIKTRIGTAEDDIDAVEAKLTDLGADTVKAAIDAAVEAGIYDDTALAGRVSTIEGDYLKATDKTDLEGKVTAEKERAEAAEAALGDRLTPVEAFFATAEGETLDEALDTLVEIQKYIDEHGEAATKMVNDIAANKTAIESEATTARAAEEALSGRIATLEAIDHDAYATTSVMNTALAGKVNVEEGKRLMTNDEGTKLEGIETGAEKNVIDAVSDEFTVGADDRKLVIAAVAMDKVTGLADALAGKVNTNGTDRLLTQAEADKLAKLVLGDDGQVEVSGTIAAGNVDGLAEWITGKRDDLSGLYPAADAGKVAAIEAGAQVNVIEAITIGGNAVTVSDKTLNIPVATTEKLGVVKANNAENGVLVDEDGAMSIHSLNVNKLTQTNGEWLVLNGGDAALVNE